MTTRARDRWRALPPEVREEMVNRVLDLAVAFKLDYAGCNCAVCTMSVEHRQEAADVAASLLRQAARKERGR